MRGTLQMLRSGRSVPSTRALAQRSRIDSSSVRIAGSLLLSGQPPPSRARETASSIGICPSAGGSSGTSALPAGSVLAAPLRIANGPERSVHQTRSSRQVCHPPVNDCASECIGQLSITRDFSTWPERPSRVVPYTQRKLLFGHVCFTSL